MRIAIERDAPGYQDIAGDTEQAVIEAMRALARWLYRRLEAEYEHVMSDDAVAQIHGFDAFASAPDRSRSHWRQA